MTLLVTCSFPQTRLQLYTQDFQFTDVLTIRSLSSNELVVSTINDDIAEQFESFICTLQRGALDTVRGIKLNQVTIRICDDDREHIHIRVYARIYIYMCCDMMCTFYIRAIIVFFLIPSDLHAVCVLSVHNSTELLYSVCITPQSPGHHQSSIPQAHVCAHLRAYC